MDGKGGGVHDKDDEDDGDGEGGHGGDDERGGVHPLKRAHLHPLKFHPLPYNFHPNGRKYPLLAVFQDDYAPFALRNSGKCNSPVHGGDD